MKCVHLFVQQYKSLRYYFMKFVSSCTYALSLCVGLKLKLKKMQYGFSAVLARSNPCSPII